MALLHYGGEFIGWSQRHLREILRQRTALKMMKFDPKPLIVFTTTILGLVAAQEISPETPENLVYLLHEEFMDWEKQHAVDEFTFHIHQWSYFRDIDQALLTRAQEAYPIVRVDEFRIHTSGHLWGEQCGVQEAHLWCWNGQEMELLEEAFSQAVF